jgi:BNR repeat-like domain
MKIRTHYQRLRTTVVLALAAMLSALLSTGCTRRESLHATILANPAAPGSLCPNETRTNNGGVLLSWLEPSDDSLALRFAVRSGQSWSSPQTVVVRKNFDKYPEAPPWVLTLPNNSLVAAWAEQLPPGKGRWPGNYLLSAASSDGGKSWSEPVIVHSDRTDGEHSFASLVSQDESHAAIVWLDARDYAARHTYRLMSAAISSSGTVSNETTVDDDVCTCCPTALIRTQEGLMAAYRNHTSDEIRDIYTVRQVSGKWQNGQSLHDDHWHINGCPVNGPSMATNKEEAVAVWFTGTEDRASVQIAFSSDNGVTFTKSATLESVGENKSVLGKVAVAALDSGDVVVSWIRRQGERAQIVLGRVAKNGNILSSEVIAEGSSDSLGYPRMQNGGSDVLVSWGGTKEAGKVSTTLITNR